MQITLVNNKNNIIIIIIILHKAKDMGRARIWPLTPTLVNSR
jgi:hypothetical protein